MFVAKFAMFYLLWYWSLFVAKFSNRIPKPVLKQTLLYSWFAIIVFQDATNTANFPRPGFPVPFYGRLAPQIASSETQGLLVFGTMRYFRAEVYFKSTSSGSARISSRWLARKILFWPISEEGQPGDSVAFLQEVVFLIDRVTWHGKILGKKDSAKLRKSQAVTSAQVYNILNIRRSIFTADLWKVYRKICIAVRDFYTVVGGERSLQSLKY